jgi:hypothetical protein
MKYFTIGSIWQGRLSTNVHECTKYRSTLKNGRQPQALNRNACRSCPIHPKPTHLYTIDSSNSYVIFGKQMFSIVKLRTAN